MKKIICVLIFVLSTILFLTGCFGKVEVDNLGIVNMITIDKNIETGQYTIGVQVVSPQRPEANIVNIWSMAASAETLMKASEKLNSQISKKLVFFHSELIIIGEQLAREDLVKAIDFFARNEQIKYNSWVLITKGSALNLLNLSPRFTNSLSEEIEGLITNIPDWSNSFSLNLKELLARFSNKYYDEITGVISYESPVISPEGTFQQKNLTKGLSFEAKQLLEFNSTAVLKNGSLKGWFNKEESRGYLWITGKIHKGTIVIKEQEKPLCSLYILNNKTALKPELKAGKIKYSLQIESDMYLTEQTCSIDLTKIENINKLERLAEEKIKKQVTNTLGKAQKDYNADIFGYSNILKQYNPEKWEKVKDEWYKVFPDIKTDIKVDITIINMGETINKVEKIY